MCDNGATECSDVVDPRVQIQLETLNNATDEINRLEGDLDVARSAFRNLLCDSTAKIDALRLKLGLCVERAKPYYEARFCANEALKQTQLAAMKYEKANSAHCAAREMVYLAEQGLGGRTLDPAWQEMLNHATQRVNESEYDRGTAAGEHRIACVRHESANAKVKMLQKDLKRAIAKSRPYYELKAHYNRLLEGQTGRINHLESQVSSSKLTYASALKNLEQISDEIHRSRNARSNLKVTINCNKQTSVDSAESYVDIAVDDDEYKSLPSGVGPVPDNLTASASCTDPQTEGYKLLPNSLSPLLSPASTISQLEERIVPVDDGQSGEWTEIDLDVSSPDDEDHHQRENGGGGKSRLQRQKTLPNPDVSDSEFGALRSARNKQQNKTRMDSASISSWIARSSAAKERPEETRTIFCGLPFHHAKSSLAKTVPGRRQSLDNILGPTGEKMKEIWSHGMMMMLNINPSSSSERRGSESRLTDSDVVVASRGNAKKLPSPLEKTLTYLNVEDDTSDCESLSSVDMLNEEQIDSLMLDKELRHVCEQVLGTPIEQIVASQVASSQPENREVENQSK